MRKLFCTAACLAAALLSVGAVHGDLVVMTTQVGTNATFQTSTVVELVSRRGQAVFGRCRGVQQQSKTGNQKIVRPQNTKCL